MTSKEMRDSQISSLARIIVQDPNFRVLFEIANEIKAEQDHGSKKRTNEYETIWHVAQSEGIKMGVDLLLKRAENYALKSNENKQG